MAGRPPSVAMMARGRMNSSMGRAPGTGMNPMTARPGTRGGGLGGALNANIHVSDRPVTRQGLGGIKTQSQGPQRQVQDKSYWLGLLRAKMNELGTEINRFTKEINSFNQENASYVAYEKRAEVLASDIKVLQGELADYNCIADRLNTNDGFDDLQNDFEIIRVQNEKEAKLIDDLFAKKQDKEKLLQNFEVELGQERRMTESLVADMPPNLREKYAMLKNRALHLQEDLELKQQQLDELTSRCDMVEEDVSMYPAKQEAVTLYEKISELEEKRTTLLEEINSTETPAQERERLLKQVKEDNQEIARMESRTKEYREKTEKIQDEVGRIDMDIEEHHGERTAKYKELKQRAQAMDEFLDNFDATKKSSEDQTIAVGENIVQMLERISRANVQSKHMPSSTDFQAMQEDLNFKADEMHKSKDTASGLDVEHRKLEQDLEKVQQLEEKIHGEMASMKEKIEKMTTELVTFSDLNVLKRNAEDKRSGLGNEKEELTEAQKRLAKDVADLSKVHAKKRSELEENETYAQLGNLERKWQHLEQNNFIVKEYIARKTAESNYAPTKEEVNTLVYQINQHLIKNLTQQ